MNDSNAALVLPMGLDMVTTDSTNVISCEVKCKPGQGKLNRTIALAQAVLTENGHAGKRFKRDYALGFASYVCPNCNATAIARTDKTFTGDAIFNKCTTVVGQNEGGDNA